MAKNLHYGKTRDYNIKSYKGGVRKHGERKFQKSRTESLRVFGIAAGDDLPFLAFKSRVTYFKRHICH